MSYILVTAAKDEQSNLPLLIDSIVNQTIQPCVWFIVDDGSRDQTPQIVEQAKDEHPWIHLVKLESSKSYDIGKHYAEVCMSGFESALRYCSQTNKLFSYIALSDADMLYPADYFAECMAFLAKNSQYGIVSGNLVILDAQGATYREGKLHLGDGQPRGTGRVWRKEAFNDSGGYLPTKAPDTVSNVLAQLRGWKIKQLRDLQFYQTRPTGGKEGLWKGYFSKGETAHYMNVNALGMLNLVIDLIFISRQRHSLTKSVALLAGYTRATLRMEEKTKITDVRDYFGSYTRVLKNYVRFLTSLRTRHRQAR